jgi:hypothetical protein
MGDSKKQKSHANTRKARSRGRSGGRGGGSGYDFQDVYVAWQLAKMLMGERDPIVEVLWEKKTIDLGSGRTPEPAHIDDAIVRLQSGKWIYTQVKETAPPGGWSARNLIKSGVLEQLWEQWQTKQTADRKNTILQLASGGSVAPLEIICDAALRSRTPSELWSEEASQEASKGIEQISSHLSVSKDDPVLLEFLRVVRPTSLPNVEELFGWIIQSLRVFGRNVNSFANHLIRIVAESKHVGIRTRSAHTRDSLLDQLLKDGIEPKVLAAAGLIVAGTQPNEEFWRDYRAELAESLRTFRVYGLDVTQPVYADLPSLYVPLKLLPLDDRSEERINTTSTRRSLIDTLEDDLMDRSDSRTLPDSATDLSRIMEETRRFVLVGTQGCGKTTTLRWLAIISALQGLEGTRIRQTCGLPAEPLNPVFIRFRRVADRIKALKRYGIRGRVGFVADFLAAEFQAGFGSHILDEEQSLRTAYNLLESKNTILLFDALDEVADESIRDQLINSVSDLLEKYPEPRVVLSSRPYALQKKHLKINLPRYSPLALDTKDTDTFCHHWYQAVRVHASDTLSENNVTKRAASLAREARRVPDFAQSPLLLSILAVVHFNQDGSLPVERAKLYNYATTAMLGHWERDPARNPGDNGIPSDWAAMIGLGDEEIRYVIERLAYDVQISENGSEFSIDDAVVSLRKGIQKSSFRSVSSKKQALLLLQLLEDRAGLIQERSSGIYGFVHLGLQEFLAARWFVSQGDEMLLKLATYAEHDRHSEVVRFAAGILASDQKWHNDEKALKFIISIAGHNALLSGACLLEAPHLEIGEDVCEEIARTAWSEDLYHFHRRTDIMSRLIWNLLNRVSKSDRLLLELLSQDIHSRRHPMGFEVSFSLLASRPAWPLTPELCWFLQRISIVNNEHEPSVVGSICELLLVEAGEEPVTHHLDGLISLIHPYGSIFHSDSLRKNLSGRVWKILREELAKPDTASGVLEKLYDVLFNTPESPSARGVARFLLSIGEPLTNEFADAIVKCAGEYGWDTDFRSWIVNIASEPDANKLIIPKLTLTLNHSDSEHRESARLILEELGIDAATLISEKDEKQEPGSPEVVVALKATNAKADEIVVNLSDALWLDAEDEGDRVWEAAVTLLSAGRTDEAGITRALIRVGLASYSRREDAMQRLLQLQALSQHKMAVTASLLDALESENAAIAAASACILVDAGDATGKGRVKRIAKALLRDPEQISGILPRIRILLQYEQKMVTIDAISEYLGEDDTDNSMSGSVALLLAKEGHLEVGNIADGLVFGGLSEPTLHDDVLPYIKKMLDNPELVTDVRKALSRALDSSHENLVWGAVRCLWNAGMRFEPRIMSAISKEGLESKNEARVQEATRMVRVLIEEPVTASSTIAVLRERINTLMAWREKEYVKAWPAVQCLLRAGVFNDENLTKVLVHGGLSTSEKIEPLIEITKQGVSESKQFSEALEKELWEAISQEKNSWRVLEMLNILFHKSIENAMSNNSMRRQTLIRVLVHTAEENPSADSFLTDLIKDAKSRSQVMDCMVQLLKDKENSIAFGAACFLIEQNDLEHVLLPKAVVRAGFSNATKSAKAMQLLDQIRTTRSMSIPLRATLSEALWDSDPQTAWNAASYIIERYTIGYPGIARALVHGGFSHGWKAPRAEGQRRLRAMLNDPDTRDATEEALISSLFIPDEGYRLNFEVASLLAGIGVDLSEALALTVDEHVRWLTAPLLALIALSGRIEETHAAARRVGSKALLELLGAEPRGEKSK